MVAPASPGSAGALPRPSRLVATLTIALLCLLWGSTWVVIKVGLEDLPVFTSAGARFLLAGLVMVALTPILRAREGGQAPPAWLWLTLGSVNFALSYSLVYLTESHLPSGLVSVLWGVFPMMMALIGHLFLPGERLHGRQWLGFVLGFMGLLVLYATDVREFGPEALPVALLLLLSPLVSAVGTALVKRHGAHVSSTLLNRNAMLTGSVLLFAAAFALERDAPARWTSAAILSVVYLALGGTVLTFGLFFWLLRTIDANRMSLIAYVTPAIALFFGWLVLGESMGATTLWGTGLILGGVVLVVRRPPAAS